MNDIFEDLLDPDTGPKPESLWWTSTRREEEERTLKVGSRGKIGTWPSWRYSIFWAIFFGGMGREARGQRRRSGKDWGSRWRDGHIYHSRSVPLQTKCDAAGRPTSCD